MTLPRILAADRDRDSETAAAIVAFIADHDATPTIYDIDRAFPGASLHALALAALLIEGGHA